MPIFAFMGGSARAVQTSSVLEDEDVEETISSTLYYYFQY